MATLFGVLSYIVEQRTKEIGVRMAIGADKAQIARLTVTHSARPIGIGLIAGVLQTAAVCRPDYCNS